MTHEKDVSSLMRQIDENLRRVYRDPDGLPDGLPDRFKELLEQLKKLESDDEG